MGKAKRNTLLIISLVLILGLLATIFGLVIYIVQEREDSCRKLIEAAQKSDPVSLFLKSLNVKDGLDVGWYHHTGPPDQLEDAVKGKVYLMFTTLAFLRDDEVFTGSDTSSSSLALAKWLDVVLSSSGKGVQIEISSDDQVVPVLEVLKTKSSVSQPVWLKVNVPPNLTDSKPTVNITKLADQVKEMYPRAGLSLGLVSDGCCPQGYTKPMVTEILKLCQGVSLPINFAAPIGMALKSWLNIRWLLEKSVNTTLTLTQTEDTCTDTFLFKLLGVRNDFVKTRIFYDIPQGQCLDDYKALSLTAGSALHHFDIDYDASRITWAHGVNSREKLMQALQDGVMFLEADILLRGQGTDWQTDIPVMAHPPDIDSNLTFSDWLDESVKTDKGLKLDFKSVDAVVPTLTILNSKRDQIRQPVWINADVLRGINSNATPRNATLFLDAVNENFPEATLSLGWTTSWTNTPADEGYSRAMVEEMHELLRNVPQPVTIPVRAVAVKRSWCHLQWLLDQSHQYTFTVWTSLSDNLEKEDMNYVRRHSQKHQIYFDLPDKWMPDV